MKNNLEKEFNRIMNEEKEIPDKVRESLEQSYDIIRAKSKKKKSSYIWKRVAAVACAIIVVGFSLTNERVMASINDFFNFGDKGIEQAINKGFVQDDNSNATDQDIKISLDNHFSDANKIGMSFQLVFEDSAMLHNVREISMDYRLKNGDGEYIEEYIPDTKPLKGENRYTSGLEHYTPFLNTKTGEVQFDVLMESLTGIIPDLKDAVIEVESVNVFNGQGEIKKIDGDWKLTVSNQHKNEEMLSKNYVMQDKESILQVAEATANPTSLNLTFSLDGIYENENTFAHRMKIIDEDGNEYRAEGFSMSKENGETVISTNFPITSYNDSTTLKMIVEGIGKANLINE